MQTFQELVVWQKAHQLVLRLYETTSGFPPAERYGLMTQMRRAAVSVVANIVEGHKRKSKRAFVNFMDIANGSLEEVKYYLVLSRDLGYLTRATLEPLYNNAEEIGRMLQGLRTHVKEEITHAAPGPVLV